MGRGWHVPTCSPRKPRRATEAVSFACISSVRRVQGFGGVTLPETRRTRSQTDQRPVESISCAADCLRKPISARQGQGLAGTCGTTCFLLRIWT